MVIIDEKCLQPPPPYVSHSNNLPPFPHRRLGPTLTGLQPHILLKIVYMTFPQTSWFDEGRLERQRKTLYWLSTSLRLVNRAFYIACMHVLRSTYLPAYDSLIRPPYSSDPFPVESGPTPSTPSTPNTPGAPPPSIITIQRETQILDLFIAVKVREDVWMDDSELHLEREEGFKDLFDHAQPKSRLEDLVRVYGGRDGVVTYASASPGPSPGSGSGSVGGTSPTGAMFRPAVSMVGKMAGARASRLSLAQGPSPVLFSSLSVSFSPRTVGLVLTSKGRKRTIVQAGRTRDEKLESTARKLVQELRAWLLKD